MKRITLFIAAVLFFSILSINAQADVIFDSGSVNFAATGNQLGRLSRNGTPSTWDAPKLFPGTLSPTTSYAYESFSMNTGIYSFIQISLNTSTTAFFDSAYLNAYLPVNSAPNNGLNVNYLGDAGFSGNTPTPNVFQIQVPTFSNLLIILNEVNSGGAANGGMFDLKVEGFTTPTNAVPEPATMLLLGSGLIGLAGYGRKKFLKK
jgi:hypothetical protein